MRQNATICLTQVQCCHTQLAQDVAMSRVLAGMDIIDVMEQGQLFKIGQYVPRGPKDSVPQG